MVDSWNTTQDGTAKNKTKRSHRQEITVPVLFLVVLFLCFVLSPAKVKAEDVLTLADAIKSALKNNHYIKSKNYSLMAADKEAAASKSAFFPKLVAEEKFTTGNYNSYGVFTRLNQETLNMGNFLNPGTVSNYQTALTMEVPVYSRELFVNSDIKKKSFIAASKDFERFKEDIAFQVFRAYLNALKSKSVKMLAEKTLEEAKEVYRISKVRVSSGIGMKADELRAFVHLKGREATLIKAENEFNISKKAIGLILSTGKAIDVLDTGLQEWLVIPSLEEAVKNAPGNRNDYVSDDYNVKNTENVVDLQKSRYYPKAFLSASYYNDGKNAPLGSDGNGYVIGLALRWELFDKARYDDTHKARFDSLKAKEYLLQRKKEIKFNIEESYMRVEEAKKRLDTAKEAIIESEETFRLIKLRYENSLSNIVELLDAELALNMARNNVIISENDYYEAVGKAIYEAGVFLKMVTRE